MVNITTSFSNSLLFKNCEHVFRMIQEGKNSEAKRHYPMEYYLVKKYFSLGRGEFKSLMARRLELQ